MLGIQVGIQFHNFEKNLHISWDWFFLNHITIATASVVWNALSFILATFCVFIQHSLLHALVTRPALKKGFLTYPFCNISRKERGLDNPTSCSGKLWAEWDWLVTHASVGGLLHSLPVLEGSLDSWHQFSQLWAKQKGVFTNFPSISKAHSVYLSLLNCYIFAAVLCCIDAFVKQGVWFNCFASYLYCLN